MKHKYTAPQIQFIAVRCNNIMATSQVPNSLEYGGSNEFDGPTVAESHPFTDGLLEDFDEE